MGAITIIYPQEEGSRLQVQKKKNYHRLDNTERPERKFIALPVMRSVMKHTKRGRLTVALLIRARIKITALPFLMPVYTQPTEPRFVQ